MRLPRAAGVLLHPTSLPGRFGIGDLGPASREFVTFLAETGQRWWQVLPIGPTGYGNSPYQSPSSFAGNPLLLSPELLRDEGWIKAEELDAVTTPTASHVDYPAVSRAKESLHRLAFERFDPHDARLASFRERNSSWLADYSVFEAIREDQSDRPWQEWEGGLASREPSALAHVRDRLDREIRYHEFLQFAFDLQWSALHEECQQQGIGFIGDVPIFVALQSADVWTRPELFQLDARGCPTHVAGVPPDAFAATGQRWGNPLYRWEAHEADGFAWWIERFRRTLDRVELLRLDHFRGFESYWRIPANAATAVHGEWVASPGIALLEAARTSLGGLPLIAEDLGLITSEVHALRDRFVLPGMKVLQFAFAGGDGANIYLPFSYPPHCVAYTGTHDNDTTCGWFRGTSVSHGPPPDLESAIYERRLVRRMAGTDGSEAHWDLIRMAYASVADTVIVPMQDILGLGSEARMNVPGIADGNWEWRLEPAMIEDRLARERLAELAAAFYRFHGQVPVPLRPRIT
jgi:4-alpha-glucanotransferase